MSYFKTDTYKCLGMPQPVELLPRTRKAAPTPFMRGWMHGVEVVKGTPGFEPISGVRLEVMDKEERDGYRLGMACQKGRGVGSGGAA